MRCKLLQPIQFVVEFRARHRIAIRQMEADNDHPRKPTVKVGLNVMQNPSRLIDANLHGSPSCCKAHRPMRLQPP